MKHARATAAALVLGIAAAAGSAQVVQVIDAAGDGAGNPLDAPLGIAIDGSGTLYVTGRGSDNAFRITDPGQPTQTITAILDASGDGAGNVLDDPFRVAVDAAGTVYVTGTMSNNVFQITDPGQPTQVVTEIIDAGGDGGGNPLTSAGGVAVDAAGTVYVTGTLSHNVLRFGPVAACTFRNGSGANPADYACFTDPVVGSTWTSTIDPTPTLAAFTAATAIAIGFGGPTSGVFVPGGEVLVVPLLFDVSVGAEVGAHSVPVPAMPAFVGLTVFTQGVRVELSPTLVAFNVQLNAQDLFLAF